MATRNVVMIPASGQLGLEQLHGLAAEFDALSDEAGGQRYKAAAFVDWLAADVSSRRVVAEGERRRRRESLGGPSAA